jgi:hypothetical protein
MKTSSAKAKGRRLQQLIRNALRTIGKPLGLEDGDIESRGMGQNGTDVILSPKANSTFGRLAIECKNVETLNVRKTFEEHAAKYNSTYIPWLIHSKNHSDCLVTMYLQDFLAYFEEAIAK